MVYSHAVLVAISLIALGVHRVPTVQSSSGIPSDFIGMHRHGQPMDQSGFYQTQPKPEGVDQIMAADPGLQNALHAFQVGIDAFGRGDIRKAAETFLESIKAYPKMMEAYMNAAVALEKLNHMKIAKSILKKGIEVSRPLLIKQTPINGASNMLCNLLLNDVEVRRPRPLEIPTEVFERRALERWGFVEPLNQDAVANSSHPEDAEVHSVCRKAIVQERNLEAIKNLARLLYLYDQPDRAVELYLEVKRMLINQLGPIHSDLSMLHHESKYLDKLPPERLVIVKAQFDLYQIKEKIQGILKQVYAGNQYVFGDTPKALAAAESMLDDEKIYTNYYNLGVINSYTKQFNPLVRKYQRISEQLVVEEIDAYVSQKKQIELMGFVPAKTYEAIENDDPFGDDDDEELGFGSVSNGAIMESRRCPSRKAVFEWKDFKDAIITPINEIKNSKWKWTPGSIYSMPHIDANEIELSYGDVLPTAFNEKELFLVEVNNVYLEGKSGVIFNDCSVFLGNHGSRPVDYTGRGAIEQREEFINVPVIFIGSMNAKNYYHFMTELVGRWALIKDIIAAGMLPPGTKIMAANFGMAPDFARFLGEEDDIFWYDPQADPSPHSRSGDVRFIVKQMFILDWQRPKWLEVKGIAVGPGREDSWDAYRAPQVALKAARDMVMNRFNQLEDKPQLPLTKRPIKVVYISRADVKYIRNILGEERLLKAIRDRLHRERIEMRIYVATPKHAAEERFWHALVDIPREQWDEPTPFKNTVAMFKDADLIIGPHGAGIANMMFCKQRAAIIYFPIRPQVDICFAQMAAAYGHELYPVDELNAFYLSPYDVRESPEGDAKIRAVIDVLDHIIENRGWKRNSTSRYKSVAPFSHAKDEL